jgi:DNA-binding GntR family transcriptional regulator
VTELIHRRSLHETLAERLRDLISAGELLPGEKIPEKLLAERFGVSRTPLREALKVLASDGTVTLRPNRGSVVSTLTVAELDEVFPVLGALEALAGELACAHITSGQLKDIRNLHQRMVDHWKARELQGYFRVNQAIHESIVEATANATLKAIYTSISGRISAARYLARMSPARWEQAVREHEDMLDALERRDGARLSAILKQHLAQKLDTVKEWLETTNTA